MLTGEGGGLELSAAVMDINFDFCGHYRKESIKTIETKF